MGLDGGFLEETVAALFGARIRDGVAPGSAVAVFGADGELLHSAGFGADGIGGLTEGGVPGGATPGADTAFRIASCTKSFTAAAALLLRDRGLLVLDSPITDFVPEFHWLGERSDAADVAGAPTLRQLLSMSGGLSTDDPWADRQEGLSDEEFRAVLAAGTPRDGIPGTGFRYSNLGYALVGQAIARASGTPFIDFVTAELLEPLGLDATGFRAEGRPGRTAVGHRRGATGEWHPLPFSQPGAFSPIGGVVTTARDLARWGAWLASALGDAPQPGPLSAASRRELQQVHRTIPTTRPGVQEHGYGFGLMVEKGETFGHTASHSGGYPGYSAHLRWNAPGGFGVIAFENAGYAGVSAPATALADAIIERLGRAPRHPEPWPQTVELARAADRLIDAWATDAPAAADAAVTDAAAEALEAAILSPNVAEDRPIAERRAEVRRLGVLPAEGGSRLEASASPAVVSWLRAAASGAVRVRLSLAPIEPARIQTLALSPEDPPENSRE